MARVGLAVGAETVAVVVGTAGDMVPEAALAFATAVALVAVTAFGTGSLEGAWATGLTSSRGIDSAEITELDSNAEMLEERMDERDGLGPPSPPSTRGMGENSSSSSNAGGAS